MSIPVSGNDSSPPDLLGVEAKDLAQTENVRELLLYWIRERYDIFSLRKRGVEKPWSADPVFRRTYFCNVHRENDRVTQWIRNFYNPYVGDHMFEYNITLSRFLNWPITLEEVGYRTKHDPEDLLSELQAMAGWGQKIWGGAYVITTHGIPMPKARYLTHHVLEHTHKLLDALKVPTTCQGMAAQLQAIEGVGSFLAGQIVADLKNTPGHKLYLSTDCYNFVVPGPGSVRGASWFHFGCKDGVTLANFNRYFPAIRGYVDLHIAQNHLPSIDNQDLQNCLCEFDKYMRVRNGTGRSKRGYNGY